MRRFRDIKSYAAWNKRRQDAVQRLGTQAMRRAALRGRADVVRSIQGREGGEPIVDTGELSRSVRVTKTPKGAVLEVTAKHAGYLELGTKPFRPPFGVLLQWASRKLRGGALPETDRGRGRGMIAQGRGRTRSLRPRSLAAKAPSRPSPLSKRDQAVRELAGRDVRMTLDPTGEISVTVAALDEKPLRKSQRMFLCVVGEVKGADEPDEPEKRKTRKDRTMGLPLVMKPPVGEIAFMNPVEAVYALDLSGRRKAKLKLEKKTTIRLDNSHRSPWFEIVR